MPIQAFSSGLNTFFQVSAPCSEFSPFAFSSPPRDGGWLQGPRGGQERRLQVLGLSFLRCPLCPSDTCARRTWGLVSWCGRGPMHVPVASVLQQLWLSLRTVVTLNCFRPLFFLPPSSPPPSISLSFPSVFSFTIEYLPCVRHCIRLMESMNNAKIPASLPSAF